MAKLRPYGSKRLQPFGAKPSEPDPLVALRADIERLIAEQDALIAEELRLFQIVDKGSRQHTDAAFQAREQWNVVWRKLDRSNAMLHAYIIREREQRNGRRR